MGKRRAVTTAFAEVEVEVEVEERLPEPITQAKADTISHEVSQMVSPGAILASRVASVELPGGEGNQNDYLRIYAGNFYKTHAQGVSIIEMSRMPQFNVSLTTLRNWSRADGWVQNRKNFWSKINDEAEKKLATSLARERVRTLEKIDQMFNTGFDKLTGADAPEAKSFEQLLNAVGRMAQLRDDMQDKIINSVSSQKFLGNDEEQTKIEIPEEERRVAAQEAAKALLLQRRGKLNQPAKVVDADIEE